MKKLILKTAIITFGVALVLAISIFGIVSLCAPAAMMGLCDSLGLEGLCGDYAFREYERSGDLDCLTRSFFIAAERGDDEAAKERFDALVKDGDFSSYCEKQDDLVVYDSDGVTELERVGYGDHLFAVAVCVEYRLASSDAEKDAALLLAEEHTSKAFPSGNPLLMLSVEAAQKKDMCSRSKRFYCKTY